MLADRRGGRPLEYDARNEVIVRRAERHGIATVVLQLLREVAQRVQPPRALFVPFRHGYPLDRPNDPARQRAVIEAALQLLEDTTTHPPVLREYQPADG